MEYENVLRKIFPSYNLGTTHLSGFRPDLIHADYDECSVLNVGRNDSSAITAAIRRRANFVEFTAVQNVTKASVVDYLGQKIKNYIRLMESA